MPVSPDTETTCQICEHPEAEGSTLQKCERPKCGVVACEDCSDEHEMDGTIRCHLCRDELHAIEAARYGPTSGYPFHTASRRLAVAS